MTYQIAIPHTGKLSAGLVSWLTEHGHVPFLQKTYSACKGRNILMDRFIHDSKADWLVYLDADEWPATEGLLEFATTCDDPFVVLPCIGSNMKWAFALEGAQDICSLSDYEPHGDYSFKRVWLSGGGGMCLRRDLVNALPQPIWQEAPNGLVSEDFLFSYTLTKKLGVKASVAWGGAMHHDKDGFDTLRLSSIDYAKTFLGRRPPRA